MNYKSVYRYSFQYTTILRVLQDFEVKLTKNFFEIDFAVTVLTSGECQVTQSVDPIRGQIPIREWREIFIGKTFPGNYRLKPNSPSNITINPAIFGRWWKTRKLIIFVRDILAHFGDRNMDAYAISCYYVTLPNRFCFEGILICFCVVCSEL